MNWIKYVYSVSYGTVKPVCNDHLFIRINYLKFIQ